MDACFLFGFVFWGGGDLDLGILMIYEKYVI
jgi:hypothetical protein